MAYGPDPCRFADLLLLLNWRPSGCTLTQLGTCPVGDFALGYSSPFAEIGMELNRYTMKQTLPAVFEKGVFRPLELPRIADGQNVTLTVEEIQVASQPDILRLAARVYEGLTEQQVLEIEQIALDRRSFFTGNFR